MGDECEHSRLSFEDIRDRSREALKLMFTPLINEADEEGPIPHGPSWNCMRLAHELGELLFYFQASYILLQPHVRVQVSHNYVILF